MRDGLDAIRQRLDHPTPTATINGPLTEHSVCLPRADVERLLAIAEAAMAPLDDDYSGGPICRLCEQHSRLEGHADDCPLQPIDQNVPSIHRP